MTHLLFWKMLVSPQNALFSATVLKCLSKGMFSSLVPWDKHLGRVRVKY